MSKQQRAIQKQRKADEKVDDLMDALLESIKKAKEQNDADRTD